MMDTATQACDLGWKLDNSYSRLAGDFFELETPTPVKKPQLILFNEPLANALGLNADTLKGDLGTRLFSGNALPEASTPLAQAYAGHQYAHFTMLGDGRAILLGEQITPLGERFDIQLKGSGQTAFSRRGDGRAGLGPMLREYIMSEAMTALGIPTTRSLAVVSTGETVYREAAQPGAILTRVASSHIRVGTFEYIARRSGKEGVQILADYTIERHFPELLQAEGLQGENKYLAFLNAVVERQARLIAKWQCVGFIHGVMNTDNMAISGETIDYGPCAFMDTYDPLTVFSSIDRNGRYAYHNQPQIAQWNLARLAETLISLVDSDEKKAIELATQAITNFPALYQQHWLAGMRAKLGLFTEESEDTALVESLLEWMQFEKQDYTTTFRSLSLDIAHLNADKKNDGTFMQWHADWMSRCERQEQSAAQVQQWMDANNPVIIPRNYKVELALQAAEKGDLNETHRLLKLLVNPYQNPDGVDADFALPPTTPDLSYRTFCGT